VFIFFVDYLKLSVLEPGQHVHGNGRWNINTHLLFDLGVIYKCPGSQLAIMSIHYCINFSMFCKFS